MNKFFSTPIAPTEKEHVLTTTDGTYNDTRMNVTLYHLGEGEKKEFNFEKEESAFLLISGDVTFEWNGQSSTASRANCFVDSAVCLQACKGTDVAIVALTNSEILVQSTENPKRFFSVLHSSRTIRKTVVDTEFAEGKGQYTLNTIFDYDTAPHSNLVLTEVIVPQGGWAGATRHSHPHPEVNYYRFDKPQGFGFFSDGDAVSVITDRCYSIVTEDAPHTRATAPGYPLYFTCVIRHFAGAPWRDRKIEPCHQWIVG